MTTLEDCGIYDQGKKSLPFSLAASLCFCGIRTSGGNLQEALEGGTMHWHASLTASLPFFWKEMRLWSKSAGSKDVQPGDGSKALLSGPWPGLEFTTHLLRGG